jgi:hypothetical protein
MSVNWLEELGLYVYSTIQCSQQQQVKILYYLDGPSVNELVPRKPSLIEIIVNRILEIHVKTLSIQESCFPQATHIKH